jgi:hypothetical protein
MVDRPVSEQDYASVAPAGSGASPDTIVTQP